jgi:hypothetical protein
VATGIPVAATADFVMREDREWRDGAILPRQTADGIDLCQCDIGIIDEMM